MIREVRRSLEAAAKRNQNLKKAFYRARGLYHGVRMRIFESRAEPAAISDARRLGVNPENVLWIFSTARSGTTWLRGMLADLLAGSEVWEEPKVSQLFGNFYERAQQGQLGSTDFVMGDPTRAAWTRALRNFVLEAARASHPSMTPGRHLVVKEPGGAVGAPLLMQALPESRMILLVRDPRDVVASVLDAQKEGSWMYEAADESWRGRAISADKNVNAHVRILSNRYVRQMGNGRRAFDAHGGPKALVKYEDLRADAAGTLRRACSELGLPVDEGRIARVVAKHDWDILPEAEKGAGRFHRKATPGGWKVDLTQKQAEMIGEISAPILREFYP